MKVNRNLANRAYIVAKKNNLSYSMVHKVIEDFLETLDESAVNGERITLNGYVSIDVILGEEPSDVRTRGRVSESLQQRVIQKRMKTAGLVEEEN